MFIVSLTTFRDEDRDTTIMKQHTYMVSINHVMEEETDNRT